MGYRQIAVSKKNLFWAIIDKSGIVIGHTLTKTPGASVARLWMSKGRKELRYSSKESWWNNSYRDGRYRLAVVQVLEVVQPETLHHGGKRWPKHEEELKLREIQPIAGWERGVY